MLSISVSLTAVLASCVIGMLLGAAVAVLKFRGRGAVTILLNSLMGLPPVVVGLGVYLLLSRAGPLGVFGLLYTPTAMIIAQTILVMPIVAALTRQVVEDFYAEYDEQLRSLGVRGRRLVTTLLWDARYSLITVALAGFGRAIAEVGAVMIVGGNIDHLTRVMTTAIALETSKGNLALALALGIILVGVSLLVNGAVASLDAVSEGRDMIKSILPLRVVELGYIVNARTLLNGISLTINRGTFTVVLGPNGAVKAFFFVSYTECSSHRLEPSPGLMDQVPTEDAGRQWFFSVPFT